MEEEKENLYKLYFTVQEHNGKHSAFMQIAGFESEDEAKIYLANLAKNDTYAEVLTGIPTIH
jgi:hypothetical protein